MICPRCRSKEVVQEPASAAELYGGKLDKYRCTKCGYSSTFFLEKVVRAHVFISGRVQGVFFRSKTTKEAKKLGLAGYVKNLPDGRVEAVFEGEEENVHKIIEWCREGPGSVSKVEVSYESPKNLQKFERR